MTHVTVFHFTISQYHQHKVLLHHKICSQFLYHNIAPKYLNGINLFDILTRLIHMSPVIFHANKMHCMGNKTFPQ